MSSSSKTAKKDPKKDSKSSTKNDDPVTHRRQKSNSTSAAPSSGKKSSILRTNAQATEGRTPATTRDNRTGLQSPKTLSSASRATPSASRAAPPPAPAPTAPEGPTVKTRVTPISQSKYAGDAGASAPRATAAQPAGANSSMGPGGYGSAGPQGYSMGPGGYGSMGPGGYGSMGGDGNPYGSMGGSGAYGSMGQRDMGGNSFQGNPYGSMGGAGGFGSMGPGSMGGANSFQGNPYGSMGAGGYGSMGADGMGGSQMGDGMMNPYGSMGMDNGSMYGMGGGSMYGMNPMMGSMYGNPMMGSMYGMGGPMGSMYGNPMMGSMYGMNPMMGSMYGPMGGSMYGMGSQYMLGRYNSMGLGSNYGSFYNVFRTNSARAEFEPSGGYNGAMGLFTAPENFKTKRKVDPMPEPSSALTSDAGNKNGSRDAPGKKIDAADAGKSRSPASAAGKDTKDSDAKDAKSRDIKAGDKDGKDAKDAKADGKPDSKTDSKTGGSDTKNREIKESAKPDKAGAENGQSAIKSRGGIDLGKAATKTEPGVHRVTKSVDNGVHTLAVVDNKAFIDGSDPKKVKTADGKTFTMDEVVQLNDFDMDGSDLLVDVAEQVNCGHNVALLALCGTNSAAAVETVTRAVVGRAVEMNKSNEAAGEQVTVWASVAAFPQPGQCRDVLKKPAEVTPKEATYGSSPIFGPRVTNVEEQVIASAEDAQEVISKAVNATTKEEMVYILFVFKQIRSASSQGSKKGNPTADVYVSSLLVALFRDANMAYLPTIRHRSHTTFPGVLFAQAVGGACRTVVIVPVCKDETAEARGAALQQGETMREVKNGTLRSGNAARFLEFTKDTLKKSEAAQAKPAVIEQQNQMVKDAQQLISGGPEVKPKVYEVKVAAQPTSSSPSSSSKTRNLTNDKTVRVALVIENADANTVSDKDKATVTVAQQKEAEVDELVSHKAGAPYPKSDLMARTTAALVEGLNTAVLSVEGVSSVDLKARFTWVSFKNTLSETLSAASRGGDACEVHLYMCVVHQRQVLADLLDESGANAAPASLVVVSSPVVGPLVYNTKCTILKSKAEVAPAVDAALTRAAPFASKEDVMLLAVAVSKTIRQKDKDVCLASLFTASAETPAPFVGLVSEDNRYSRSLFSYAVSGPCTTTMVLVEDKSKLADPATVAKLDDVKKVASKPNLPNRDGGVRRFTAQAAQSLERAQAKAKDSKNPNEREHYERNAKKLPIMIEDHNNLLSNPVDASVPVYMPDGSRPSASGTRSAPGGATGVGPSGMTDAESVLIVLEQGGSGGPGDVKVDMENKTITAKKVSSTPTELVEMTGATMRSSHVDSIVTLTLSGYNTAMLTADTTGSTVGRSLVTRSVRMLLNKLTGKSEAYWSVVVVRNGKMKDMLAASSSFVDLQIASSPIFGPSVDGANFAKLDASGSGVEETLKTAATERAYAGGVVLATVVPKIVQDDGKDVLMPSMVLTIAGDDTKVYDAPLAVEQKQRGIFHYIFGGPCYTLFVAGIKPTEVDTTDAILATCNEVMKIKNPPLRSGSVLRFVEHSEPKLKALEGRLATAEGNEKKAITMQVTLMGKMVGDAKNLIANPVNCVPPTYGNPKNRS